MLVELMDIPIFSRAEALTPGTLFKVGASQVWGLRADEDGRAMAAVFSDPGRSPATVRLVDAADAGGAVGVETLPDATMRVGRGPQFAVVEGPTHGALAMLHGQAHVVVAPGEGGARHLSLTSGAVSAELAGAPLYFTGWRVEVFAKGEPVGVIDFPAA